MTNNSINSTDPINVALGGTGQATLTAHGVLLGNSTSGINATTSGNSNYLFTSNGSADPTFKAQQSLYLIQSQASTSGSTVAFTTNITTTFSTYLLLWSSVYTTATNAAFHMTVSTNGGGSYVTSGYNAGIYRFNYNMNNILNANATITMNIANTFGTGNNATRTANGSLWMLNVTNGADLMIIGTGQQVNSSPAPQSTIISGQSTTANVNAFILTLLSGTFVGGTFTLYGLLQ